MKIMLCISQLKKGGAERVMCNLANYFVLNNDVILYSLKNYEPAYELNKDIKLVINRSYAGKLKNNISRFKELNNIIKLEKPEIILSFLPQPSFFCLLLKLFNRIKVIVSVRNDPRQEYKKVSFKLLQKILFPLADGFVFQTEDAKKSFSKRIQKKSVIIANSLDSKFLVEPFCGTRKNEIVTVGRLFDQKNHIMLIDAFKKFHEIKKMYKLVIYGTGPKEEEIKQYIDKVGLKNSITLAGQVDNINDYIRDSKMFILSSDYEGMPNALMEALAMGIPCIATDCPCGGPRTLIKNGFNGFLVPIKDSEELSKKMIELEENSELQEKIALNASKSMKQYNPIVINKLWEDYIYSFK